ncbi:MAG: UvrD-helicase domain-containing protein [Lachnospiraceae bacterium]|nr:UvrD-helicase domain-containing protein [Candidatus Minthocola equi]
MSLLDSLNDKQREAVLATDGPVLILAGAGSGKTRVLTYRVAYLISECGVKPWNILAITFTNKAAREMRDRVDTLCADEGGMVWVATFHATCGRILRMHAPLLGYTQNFTIYDTDDQRTLIKRVLKTLDLDPKRYNERQILSRISSAKNDMISPDAMARVASGNYFDMQVANCYEEYQKQLKANDAMDFDDMLLNVVELFKKYPEVLKQYQDRFKYIMVDEYQDTNKVQFAFIKMLAAQHKNICVVGDDDQSIYKFRGADITNILNFEETFPGTTVIKLEQNYRSTPEILKVANDVIRHNAGRKDKSLWTARDAGEKVDFREYDTGYEEAEEVITDIKANRTLFDYGQVAVLYRTNAQSRLFEEKCVLYDVPYRIVGGVNFYQRKEIKDVISYLRVIAGGQDDLSCIRIINEPKRGIGVTTVTRVSEYAAGRSIGFLDALKEAGQIPGVSGGTADKISAFVGLIDGLQKKAAHMPLRDLMEAVLDESGYIKALKDEGTVEAETRIENIQELVNKAAEITYESNINEPEKNPYTTSLTQFLEETALISDVDEMNEDENRVVLMTLHGAKGLEFPRVYIAGMEDGLFPSMMSLTSENPDEEIEEERRLAYVGITRAMDRLSLTAASSRMVNGETRFSNISRFIKEIAPADLDRADSVKKPKLDGTSFAQSPAFGKSFGTSKPASVSTPVLSGKAYMGKEFVVNKASSLSYSVGDRVCHSKFGEGVVQSIVDGKQDFEVTVDFDSVGTKKMFASFAKLEKV